MVLPIDGSAPVKSLPGSSEDDPEPESPEEPEDVAELSRGSSGRDDSVPDVLQRVAPQNTGWMEDYNALDELFSEGKGEHGIDLRTELNELQIIQFARARAISEYHKIPMLSKFINNIARLSVSKGRKGRREFVEAFRSAAISDTAEGMGMAAGMMGKLKS